MCQISNVQGGVTTGNGAVLLDNILVRQLVDTNTLVNHRMRQVSDGVGDRWTVGGSVGDCEDFALTKKMRLLQSGWPSSALLMATAFTRSGEPHAVLIARTNKGDVVLDNLTDVIRGWNRSGLRLRTVQSPTELWVWLKVAA